MSVRVRWRTFRSVGDDTRMEVDVEADVQLQARAWHWGAPWAAKVEKAPSNAPRERGGVSDA